MKAIAGRDLLEASLIEFRSDIHDTRVGHISRFSINEEGTLEIGWKQIDGHGYTTRFLSSNWQCINEKNVLFLRRTAIDPKIVDMPRHGCDLYVIVLSK